MCYDSYFFDISDSFRRFRSLSSGFSIQNAASYTFFKVMVTSKPPDNALETSSDEKTNKRCMVLYFAPMTSPYKGMHSSLFGFLFVFFFTKLFTSYRIRICRMQLQGRIFLCRLFFCTFQAIFQVELLSTFQSFYWERMLSYSVLSM